jgi:hypothetical protein
MVTALTPDDLAPKRATCKHCKKPIKLLWTGIWTHDVVMTDNQVACISTTRAEPKKVRS